MEDLPPIDAVLISHNHFDHLDLPTLRQLGLVEVLLLWWPLGVLACFAPKESNPFTSWIGEGHWPFRRHHPLRTGPALLSPRRF
jgi:hypothetical protein